MSEKHHKHQHSTQRNPRLRFLEMQKIFLKWLKVFLLIVAILMVIAVIWVYKFD